MKKWRKVLIVIGGLVGAGGIAIFVAITILAYLPDDPLEDDSDLEPHYLLLADSESNPFPLFGKSIKVEEITDEESQIIGLPFRDRDEQQWQVIRDVIKRNEKCLEQVHVAIETDGWKNPLIEFSHETDLVAAQPIRKASLLMKLRAELHLVEGNHELAINEALRILKLGKRYESAGGSLIDGLVAFRILGQRQLSLLNIIEDGEVRLSSETIDRIASVVASSASNVDCFADNFRVDYQIYKNAVNGLEDGSESFQSLMSVKQSSGRKSFFQPNRTINEAAKYTRVMIGDLRSEKSVTEFKSKEFEAKFELRKPLNQRMSSNAVGDILLGLIFPTSFKSSKFYASAEVQNKLLLVALASAKFEKEHSRSLKSLNELVPNYLTQIPTDPFDGKPSRFNPINSRVYSRIPLRFVNNWWETC